MKIIHLEGGLGDLILNLHHNEILELHGRADVRVNIFTNNDNAYQLFEGTTIEVNQYPHSERTNSALRTENYTPHPRDPKKPLDFPITTGRLSTILKYTNTTIFHPWSHGVERKIPINIRNDIDGVLYENETIKFYYIPPIRHHLTPAELYTVCRFAKKIVSSFSFPANIAWLLDKPLYLIYPQHIWDWQVPLQKWNQNLQSDIDNSQYSYRVNYENFNINHFKAWLLA